jgi:hypothetical protein
MYARVRAWGAPEKPTYLSGAACLLCVALVLRITRIIPFAGTNTHRSKEFILHFSTHRPACGKSENGIEKLEIIFHQHLLPNWIFSVSCFYFPLMLFNSIENSLKHNQVQIFLLFLL